MTANFSGAKHASGTLLIFVDADTTFTEGVLRSAMTAIDHGAIGGAAPIRFDGDIPLYAYALAPLWTVIQSVFRVGTGGFSLCTREAFQAAGRFDETLYAFEDVALSRRLKRLGKFVILRETVLTSGRNLRAHSGRDALRMMGGLIRGGRAFFRSREGLNYWYRDRRGP